MLRSARGWLANRQWRRLALPSFLLLLSVFVYVGSISPSYTECAYQHELKDSKQEKNGAYYRPSIFVICEIGVLNDNSGAITALATALLTWITYLLVRLGRDQSRTTRAQLRAYVSAAPQNMVLHPDGMTYLAIVDLENTGSTPAFEAQASAQIKVMDYPRKRPLLINLTDDGTPVPTFVIFPGAKHITVAEKVLDQTERQNLRDGKHALYVMGVISFVDAFDVPQWTEFCVFLDGPDHDEWLQAARSQLGAEVPARFRFTEMNNRASNDRCRSRFPSDE